MNKYIGDRKLVIYTALRQLPGKLGRRYERKIYEATGPDGI